MPVEFLSDEQVARFGRFVAEPSPLELERCFRLDANALRLICDKRRDENLRVAGIELLSYGLGPSGGQLHACAVASLTGVRTAIWSGGLLCVAAIGGIYTLLPRFAGFSVTSHDHGEEQPIERLTR